METLHFILACYGMTFILVYGKIFEDLRPKKDYTKKWNTLFHCPLCVGFWVGSCAMWVTTVWTMSGYFSGSPCAPLGMQAAMATTSGVAPRKAGGVDFEAATDMTSDGVALVPSVPSPQVRISAPSRIDLHTARRGTHRPSRQATGDARRWLAEHGEQGFRYPGDRTEEILEEQLAKAFRQHVVDLMLEYAHFDEERRFYCDRAVAIALLCFAFALL